MTDSMSDHDLVDDELEIREDEEGRKLIAYIFSDMPAYSTTVYSTESCTWRYITYII